MNRRDVRQSGSALIITILLVTVLAAIAFGSSRLTISEIVQTGQLESSELSYQAAEGCIETGLLLYRYNRNAEAPADVAGGMSDSVKQYLYFDLSDGSEITKSQFDARDSAKSYCTLRMWHKNDNNIEYVKARGCTKPIYDVAPNLCVADTEGWCNGKTFTNPSGEQDTIEGQCYSPDGIKKYIYPAISQFPVTTENVNYDVSQMSQAGDRLKISWQFVNNAETPDKREEYKLIYSPQDENGKIVSNAPEFARRTAGGSYPFDYEYSYNNQIGRNVDIPLSGISTEDGPRNVANFSIIPTGSSLLWYQLETPGSSQKFDSRYTMIDAVGYYGNTKRRLKTLLDRKTTSTLNPVQMLIYAQEKK